MGAGPAPGRGRGPDRAARRAFWLGFHLFLRGEGPRASGWLARAERLSAEAAGGPRAGFLFLLLFLARMDGGGRRPGLTWRTG